MRATLLLLLYAAFAPQGLMAQTLLFEDVRIVDGTGEPARSGNVLAREGLIDDVSVIERPDRSIALVLVDGTIVRDRR